MRKPIVAGNWKMNKTVDEAIHLAEGVKTDLASCKYADVVLCAPFTALKAVGSVIDGTAVKLGAQNMHWNLSGAHTGEISPQMLKDVFCQYVILGHSERRTDCAETDEIVNRKTKAALESNLRPIVCVGETLEEREAGKTNEVVETQVRGSLAGIAASSYDQLVLAYEPVWAIGTGKTASPEQAQEVHAKIRSVIADLTDQATADALRIQYGGSMKPGNAKELLGQPDIDGGLIGGAALEAASFVEIVRAAE